MTGLIIVAYALLTVATVQTAEWCITYHRLTRGGWWSTTKDGANWHGRNFMGLVAVLSLMMAFTLAGPLLPQWVLLWVSMVLFAAVIVVIGHRRHLLVTDQRRAHPRDVARDAARDTRRDGPRDDARDIRRDGPRDKARDIAHDEQNPR